MKIRDIIEAVAQEYGIESQDILSPRQKVRYAEPRYLVNWFCVDLLPMKTHTQIAKALNRSHENVQWRYEKAEQRLGKDEAFREKHGRILCRLASRVSGDASYPRVPQN